MLRSMSNEAIANIVTILVLLFLFVFLFWDVVKGIYELRKRVLRSRKVNVRVLVDRLAKGEISTEKASRIVFGYEDPPKDLML